MIIKKITHFFGGIRLILLQIMIIIVLLFSAGIFLFYQNSSIDQQTVDKTKDLALRNSFNAISKVKSDNFEVILFTYACYSWMVDFIKNPKEKKPEDNITATKSMGLSVFQVFDLNKNTVYCSNTELYDNDTLLFNDSFFNKLYKKRNLIFFIKYDTLLIEIHASTVHRSEDVNKTGKPEGYLIVGKLWNKEYINELSTITNSKIKIKLLKKSQVIAKHFIQLKDINDKPIATVNYQPVTISKDLVLVSKGFFETFSILTAIIIIILCIGCFEYYIMRPIHILDESLRNEDFALLGPIIQRENELSSIAGKIQEYYGQVDWAHSEIAEMNRTKNELTQINEELLKQKETVEKQNEELANQSDKLASAHYEIMFKNNQLEYQNAQITDSIKYASMIQKAVLTPQFNLEKTFKDHLIFYKPKEILSGDFYWFKEFYGKYYFACADCTGHGFSGAMMSMLGISFLNELTHHHNDRNVTPAIILDKLRLKVVETLHQTGEIGQIRDGMDIGLCMFDPENNKLEFAGAYNILYQIVNTPEGTFDLIEHKGDRMPVGIYDKPEPFTNYSFDLTEGDTFYLSTDGYIDQFGGPNKKKLNKQNFKNLLLSIQHLNLTEQRLYIKEFLKSWIGTLEQVDDITVVGIKLL
jgi:serine phosphatase RsbU (regulator of sigma subunit)